MAYACRILLDSITECGHRLTTWESTFPRIVLAEVNTHRDLSRNSASSRAIPVDKRIAAIKADPFVPEQFGRNKKGMQHDEVLEGPDDHNAREAWRRAMLGGIGEARVLSHFGVHKQLANRLLEPFAWHTAVISATETDNFKHLRVNPAAQGEFQRIAEWMMRLRAESEPTRAAVGYWHLPYVYGPGGKPMNPEDIDWATEYYGDKWLEVLAKVSVARCARVSYLTQNGKREPAEDLGLFDRLVGPGHLSPLEHAARPMDADELGMFLQWQVTAKRRGEETRTMRVSVPPNELQERFGFEVFDSKEVHFCGNYNGWVQFRKLVPGEHDILGYRNALV